MLMMRLVITFEIFTFLFIFKAMEKVPSSHMGQVNFRVRQGTFHSHLSGGKIGLEVIHI